MSSSPTGESRPWQLAAQLARQVEEAWDDPLRRQQKLLECRRWLEQQQAVPRLHRLAGLITTEMTRRQFWSVLVPLERADSRRRITDSAILEQDRDPALSTAQPMPLTVVADNLRSAFNVGGIFRTAEHLGAAAVWLCGYSATPEHPHVAAAALKSETHLPWRYFERAADALRELRRAGVWIVALETVAGAPTVDALPWQFPCAVVLGNERFGLDPETIAAGDVVTRIPAYGCKNSLNVVNACAICAWEARRAWDAGAIQNS